MKAVEKELERVEEVLMEEEEEERVEDGIDGGGVKDGRAKEAAEKVKEARGMLNSGLSKLKNKMKTTLKNRAEEYAEKMNE